MHEPNFDSPAEPIQVRKRRTKKPPQEVVPEVANSGLIPQQRIDKPIVIFDTDNTQNYIMIILIALIQGSLDLCHLSYFYIYLYDLKTTPSELSILQGISILPWVFKPWFGFISDHFKFMGYHKKSYIFTVSLLEFSTHIIMFKYRFGLPLVIFCQVVQVGCVAFRNVIGGMILPHPQRLSLSSSRGGSWYAPQTTPSYKSNETC